MTMITYYNAAHTIYIDPRVAVFGNTCLECIEQIQILQKNLKNQLRAICDQDPNETCGITVTISEIAFEYVVGYISGHSLLKVTLYAPENISFEYNRCNPTEQVVDPVKILKNIFPCITEMQKQNQNTQYQFIETVGEKDPNIKEQLIKSFNKAFAI